MDETDPLTRSASDTPSSTQPGVTETSQADTDATGPTDSVARPTTPDSTPETPLYDLSRSVVNSSDELTSVTVIDAVAAVTCTDPLDLDPLYYTIDPDSLDGMFSARFDDRRTDVQVQFTYEGCRVTVTRDRDQVTVEVSERV